MSRDRKNVFQLTPAQMRKKIREYKRTKANSPNDISLNEIRTDS